MQSKSEGLKTKLIYLNLFSVYGSRNIAWPWFIRYATDYSYNWPIWHVLHLYDYGQRIVFMSFLLNLLLTGRVS